MQIVFNTLAALVHIQNSVRGTSFVRIALRTRERLSDPSIGLQVSHSYRAKTCLLGIISKVNTITCADKVCISI